MACWIYTSGALERGQGWRLAFSVMNKSSVKFSFEVRCLQPGLMDIWSEHLLSFPRVRISFWAASTVLEIHWQTAKFRDLKHWWEFVWFCFLLCFKLTEMCDFWVSSSVLNHAEDLSHVFWSLHCPFPIAALWASQTAQCRLCCVGLQEVSFQERQALGE